MRDDEELKYEKASVIETAKSAIAKQLRFRCLVGVSLSGEGRKRNADIQTYNVDFLLEQEETKKTFEEARKMKIYSTNNVGGHAKDAAIGDGDSGFLEEGADAAEKAFAKGRIEEARYKEYKDKLLAEKTRIKRL
jgi:hypothetical protein